MGERGRIASDELSFCADLPEQVSNTLRGTKSRSNQNHFLR